MSVQRPDQSDERDPFALLGVERGCSPDELVKAYHALARRYHPDVNRDADAANRMRAINAAFARARQELRAQGSSDGSRARATVRIVHWHDHAPLREAARWRGLRGWAIGGVLLIIVAALVWAITAQLRAPGTPANTVHAPLGPGQQAVLTWPEIGRVAFAERTLATLTAGLYPHDRPQWSSDGHYVALAVDDAPVVRSHPQILVYKATTFAQVAQISGFGARWAPNSDQLALLVAPASGATPQLVVADIARGAQSVWVKNAGTHLAWSPDGSAIAFSAQMQRAVDVLDLTTQTTHAAYIAPRGDAIIPIGWLDAATVLCLAQMPGDTQLVALPLASAQFTTITDLGSSSVMPVSNQRTGQLLYVTQADAQSPGKLFLNNAEGQSATLIDARGGFDAVAGWSNDGDWLAYATQAGHSQMTSICLLPLQATTVVNWPASATRCLAVSGLASNLAWENAPGSDRLSFVVAGPKSIELNDLMVAAAGNLSPTPTTTTGAATRGGMWPGSAGSAPSSQWGALMLLGIVGWWRGSSRATPIGQAPPDDETEYADGHEAPLPALRFGIISEALKWPPDEALKRIALAMVREMESQGEVLAIGTRGQRRDAEPYPGQSLRTNRMLLSPRLWSLFAGFQPNVICYIPGSGLTTWSLVRALILRAGLGVRGQHPLLTLVGVQPRQRGLIGRRLLAWMRPALVIVQSRVARETLLAQGCANVHVLKAGVDLNVFAPVSTQRRLALREAYGIAPDRFVVLHVGHLKSNRQLDDLIPLARQLPNAVVLVVGSTSTVADHRVAARLRAAGIQLIHRYLSHIEEVYQLADCYVFPVRDDQASAQLPLSVLEALACELPVVTTRFGALPEYLPAGAAIAYCDSREDLIAAVRARQQQVWPATDGRSLVDQHGWHEQFAALAWELRSRLARRTPSAPTAALPAPAGDPLDERTPFV